MRGRPSGPRLTLAVIFLLWSPSACRRQAPHYSDAVIVSPEAKQIPKTPQQQANLETKDEAAAAASFAGCYELKLGRWWPWGFGGDNEYVTPPSRIQLLAERGTKGFEQDGYLIRRLKSATSGRRAPSYWQVRSSDQIDLIWNDGFTGVVLALEKHGDELRGRAHPHFDAVPLIPRAARVTAKRIACEPNA